MVSIQEKERLDDILTDVLELMEKTGEKEPSEVEAVNQLCDTVSLTEGQRNNLEIQAFFRWPDYSQGR